MNVLSDFFIECMLFYIFYRKYLNSLLNEGDKNSDRGTELRLNEFIRIGRTKYNFHCPMQTGLIQSYNQILNVLLKPLNNLLLITGYPLTSNFCYNDQNPCLEESFFEEKCC